MKRNISAIVKSNSETNTMQYNWATDKSDRTALSVELKTCPFWSLTLSPAPCCHVWRRAQSSFNLCGERFHLFSFSLSTSLTSTRPRPAPYSTWGPAVTGMTNELKLKFYGLFKQATDGPCNEKEPGRLQVVERMKWSDSLLESIPVLLCISCIKLLMQ